MNIKYVIFIFFIFAQEILGSQKLEESRESYFDKNLINKYNTRDNQKEKITYRDLVKKARPNDAQKIEITKNKIRKNKEIHTAKFSLNNLPSCYTDESNDSFFDQIMLSTGPEKPINLIFIEKDPMINQALPIEDHKYLGSLVECKFTDQQQIYHKTLDNEKSRMEISFFALLAQILYITNTQKGISEIKIHSFWSDLLQDKNAQILLQKFNIFINKNSKNTIHQENQENQKKIVLENDAKPNSFKNNIPKEPVTVHLIQKPGSGLMLFVGGIGLVLGIVIGYLLASLRKN
jgi:hypothetical protein